MNSEYCESLQITSVTSIDRAIFCWARSKPEEDEHAPGKGLKVDRGVDSPIVSNVSEEGCAEDGIDECDEQEECSDVEESRQGNGQSKQQLSDPLRSLQIQ